MNVQKPDLLFFYAESPIHWGTGTSVGVVDLPIQRERHTDYPMGQSSGIKGALRDWFEARKDPFVTAAFGPESNAAEHAGCVAFGDARLLLFPVRTLRGTFAYCTSRVLLARWKRDLELAGVKPSVAMPPESSDALVATGSPLLHNQRITLEEFPIAAKVDPSIVEIGRRIGEVAAPGDFWAKRIASHLAVLPDDLFRDLVRTATTIETHVRIDNRTGTADERGLFYEELLPPDSVLYSSVYVADPLVPKSSKGEGWPASAAEVRNTITALKGQRVQMGAGATSGRGIVYCSFVEGDVR